MHANTANKLIPLASLLGAIGCLAACESSEKDSNETGAASGAGGTKASAGAGSGGVATSGGRTASGGTAGASATGGAGTAGTSGGAGSAGTSGGAVGAGGVAGMDCRAPGPVTTVFWLEDEGAGGEAGIGGEGGTAGNVGVGDIFCFPGLVCFTRSVPTPGLSFVKEAAAAMGASESGEPVPWQPGPSGLPTAKVSYPKTGTVCMRGDDGATLVLNLAGLAHYTEGTVPAMPDEGRDDLFHASDLGITGLSFKVETPPSSGLHASFLSADRCGEALFSDSKAFSTSGDVITLAFVADFTPAFDTNAVRELLFSPGAGAYDFCVTDLAFLDTNGVEVKP